MTIGIRMTAKVKVLTLNVKDWKMDNGRSGVSYKIGVRSDGDIGKLKVTPELYGRLREDQECVLSGVLTISNNNASVVFDDIEPTGTEPGKPSK